MGKSQRDKGQRAERELATLLGGEKIPLSGATGGSFSGDVKALGLTWEVKVRGNGFRELYRWLDSKDALAIRADRKGWLVVLPLETFRKYIERGNGTT